MDLARASSGLELLGPQDQVDERGELLRVAALEVGPDEGRRRGDQSVTPCFSQRAPMILASSGLMW